MSNENYDTKVLETLSARLALVEKAIGADKLQEAKSAMSDAELEAVAGGYDKQRDREEGRFGTSDRYERLYGDNKWDHR